MSSEISTNAVIFMVIVAATLVPSANAAPDDACLVLSQAQVSVAVGVAMAAGTHVTPTFLKTCTWAPSGGATKDISSLTLTLQTAEAYDVGKRTMEQVAMAMKAKNEDTPPPVVTAVPGLGDDAFYLDMAHTMSLIVKKGSGAFKIVMYGGLPQAKKQSAEKTLALQVLSKL